MIHLAKLTRQWQYLGPPRVMATVLLALLSLLVIQLTLSETCNAQGLSCNEGDVRLVNRSSTVEGRLEICYSGMWGAVCRAGFDDYAATVVCKQLGGVSSVGISMDFSGSTGDRFITKVFKLVGNGCTGKESHLADCSAHYAQYRGYNSSCAGIAGVQCITLLLVKKLSGGEIFAIIFCCLLFVGSIIVLVLGLAYYKQRQYKKLVRTHSSSDSSSDIHPPTASETVQGVEQVGVATHDEPTPINQDPTHSASEPPPPAYCDTSEQ